MGVSRRPDGRSPHSNLVDWQNCFAWQSEHEDVLIFKVGDLSLLAHFRVGLVIPPVSLP